MDCPDKDANESECGNKSMPAKRIKTETYSQSVSTSTKHGSIVSKHVAQPETLSVQLSAAHEQIRLLNELIKTKDALIAALQKQQSS